jgi:hypothetical protein
VKGAGIERAAEMRHASIPQLHQLADAVPGRYRALILLAGYGGLAGPSWSGCVAAMSIWPALGSRWSSRRPRSPARWW